MTHRHVIFNLGAVLLLDAELRWFTNKTDWNQGDIYSMAKTLKKNRGRPPKFVRDSKGKVIYGLSAQRFKKDGRTRLRYYATFSSPRKWFGFDVRSSFVRFGRWLIEQGQSPPEDTFIFGIGTMAFSVKFEGSKLLKAIGEISDWKNSSPLILKPKRM